MGATESIFAAVNYGVVEFVFIMNPQAFMTLHWRLLLREVLRLHVEGQTAEAKVLSWSGDFAPLHRACLLLAIFKGDQIVRVKNDLHFKGS